MWEQRSEAIQVQEPLHCSFGVTHEQNKIFAIKNIYSVTDR